jgi:predicted Ser/Thr protein kinase
MVLAALNPPSPHPMQLDGEQLLLAGEVYVPITELGRGKSAVSYLYQQAEGRSAQGLPPQIVLKRYCPTPNQTIPFAQALEFELCSYMRLQQANIAHPRLLGYSTTGYCLAKEYIPGELITDLLLQNALDDRHFRAILEMAAQLQRAGWHIDYFPANFVLTPHGLYYIDYEAHPYNAEWDFAHWGIFYWLNPEGMRQFLATGDDRHINKPGQPKPWDEPFWRQRESLLRRLAPEATV